MCTGLSLDDVQMIAAGPVRLLVANLEHARQDRLGRLAHRSADNDLAPDAGLHRRHYGSALECRTFAGEVPSLLTVLAEGCGCHLASATPHSHWRSATQLGPLSGVRRLGNRQPAGVLVLQWQIVMFMASGHALRSWVDRSMMPMLAELLAGACAREEWIA